MMPRRRCRNIRRSWPGTRAFRARRPLSRAANIPGHASNLNWSSPSCGAFRRILQMQPPAHSNGQCREVTAFSGLKDVKARGGLLADLDFTGKLDLLAVLPGGGLRAYQNL